MKGRFILTPSVEQSKTINMKNIKTKILSGLIIILLLTNACVKDTINLDDVSDKFNRTYTVDLPGGTLRTTIKDALEEFEIDSILMVDENGLLYLNYNYQFQVEWPQVMSIENQSGTIGYSIAPPISQLKSATGTGQTFEGTERIEFTTQEGAVIDSIYIQSGNMALNFSLPAGAVDSIILGIPQLYINNEPYVDTILASSISNPYIIDLANSLIDFEEPTVDEPSGYIEFKSKVVLVENPGIITSPNIFINYNINSVIPDTIIGDFGNRVVADEPLNIEFETFDNEYLGAAIEFDDYLVEVVTENTYGTPFQVEIKDVVFEDTKTADQKQLTFDNGADVIQIDQGERGNPLVPAFNTLSINKSNSNIKDVLKLNEYAPNKVSSRVVITANPTVGDHRNFLTNGSLIKSSVNMNIPLYFKTSTYSRKDTVDFDYNLDFEDPKDDINLSEKMEYGKIYFDFENGMPFDINLQIKFVDANYNFVDQLFKTAAEQKLIESAETDVNTGLVTASTKSHFESEITKENLQNWKDGDVKYIIIETSVITNDGDKFVKVTEDNFINTTVSFSASGKFEE